MENELPNDFDLIVLGTGLIESIVASAASRIGKNVLHVDSNDYYGGTSTSFNIESIGKYLLNSKKTLPSTETVQCTEGENIVNLGNVSFGVSNVTQNWFIPKQPLPRENEEKFELAEEQKDESQTGKDDFKDVKINSKSLDWTQERILKDSRKFNLDMAPKLQFANGEFVELLISSNVARYFEYRSVSKIVTWLNGQLEIVPCLRSDVFSNTKVTVVEKRMLMKLLTTCMDGDENEFADYKNKTYYQYLKDKKLTPNLIHYVLYAIAMSTNETPCLEGIKNTKRFLNSLGRFGKTPLLYSMYGSGELPQAFCRLCAVFGGTYCLNRSIPSLIVDSSDSCLSIICGNQRINAKNFVMSFEYLPEKYTASVKKDTISRAIFITDRPLLQSEKENLTLLLFPPEGKKNPIIVIELGPATGTCPQGLFIIHMYCKQMVDPQRDLEHCVNKLLRFTEKLDDSSEQPQVLWSLYYSVPDLSNCDLSNEVPKNIFPCPGPDLDLDCDIAVSKAKSIFMKMYPECEFLPRSPDPEEIIFGDEDKCDNENKISDAEIAEDKKEIEVTEENENNVKMPKENEDKVKSTEESGHELKHDEIGTDDKRFEST